ncbi:hypothetical protein Avbf_15085 [Armadillidium vulgare]|nr:hypothetical protein Avbf_15085 [Armadillidium vulgare]
MVYNNVFVILFILYSKVVSSDSSNETDEKYTLQQYNDSTFYVQALDNKSATNEDKSLEDFLFSSHTVNTILENVSKSIHSFSPRKRETGSEEDSIRRKNRMAEDEYFTVYNGTVDKNFSLVDAFDFMRQSGSSGFPEAETDVKKSVLSALQNNSAKALLERGEITLKPMPLLTSSNRSTVNHTQSELYLVSSQNNITPLYIDVAESGLRTVEINKALTSDNTTTVGRLSSVDIKTLTPTTIQNINETFTTEIFDNLSETVTYPFTSITSSDSTIYKQFAKVTNFPFSDLNESIPHFTSTDNFESTVLVDYETKHDNAHTFKRKSATEKEFDNFKTTLTVTTDKSLPKVYHNETESHSTSALMVGYVNDTLTTKLRSHHSEVTPILFTKVNEKKIATTAKFLSTEKYFDGPTTSSINVIDSIFNKDYQSLNKSRRNHNLTEDPTVRTVPKLPSYNDSVFQSSTDDEGLLQESVSERTSSSLNFTNKINISTISSTSPDVSMGEVKIIPVGKTEYKYIFLYKAIPQNEASDGRTD